MRSRSEIVVLVTSLDRVAAAAIPHVVADRNAALQHANFTEGKDGLPSLPWQSWRARNFKHDPEHPDKFERYQAEALVHRLLPVDTLPTIVTYDAATKERVDAQIVAAGCATRVLMQPNWYL